MPAAGVHQRRDHRVLGGAGGHTALELGLPAVQRLAAHGRIRRAIGAVDQLVGAANESIQRVDGRTHVSGQPQGRAVEGGIVTELHPPAGPVRRAKAGVGGRIYDLHPANESKRARHRQTKGSRP